ncbi:MAG TPA: hypothetical protein VHS27_17910 [Gaiellales bacterium]|jgi:hypothetical protein|nr:hypothetical protein [Gaiellales bacterium]
MTLPDTWSITAGPIHADCGGDPSVIADCYEFRLVRGEETVGVTVWLSANATATHPIPQIARAAETNGQSEVERYLKDEIPPLRIMVYHDRIDVVRR